MGKRLLIVRVWLLGLSEGWAEPWSLGCGMTYDDMLLSEAYDRGANLGQWLGRLRPC